MEPAKTGNGRNDLKNGDTGSEHGILMVAFHYPPIAGSSGYLRTVYFSKYLRKFSWNPVILTANLRAYPDTNTANAALAGDVDVCRSFALDTARHLAWRKRYPLFLALPDRWVSWAVSAVFSGLRLIKRRKISVIWSTFPIPTALLIGFALKKLTGLPWVVDVRDVIVDDDFPENPRQRSAYSWLERRVADTADAIIVTTPGAMEMYRERYRGIGDRLHWIANGFDEEVIRIVEREMQPRSKGKEIVLVHSGLLSPVDRNPTLFFDAVSKLKQLGEVSRANLRIVLRASGNEKVYLEQVETKGISDLIFLRDPVSYAQALGEMIESDGLLLFQGSSCNHAVPAKIYEYFRCRKPILAITDPTGNTADLLRTVDIGIVGNCNSGQEIEDALRVFLRSIKNGAFSPLDEAVLQRFSRKSQAQQLAEILNGI